MKDLTSTAFGLLIAYLLPGLVGFHALAHKFPHLSDLYSKFLTSSSNVGIFFYVVLVALLIGLQLSALRWLAYEQLVFRFTKRYSIQAGLFQSLAKEEKLVAFRAAIDELYRYHQFWGGLSVAIVLFVMLSPSPQGIPKSEWYILVTIVELVTVVAAAAAYGRYIDRVKVIL